MTNTPTVSIITPAYNSSAFIAETIHSVLAQTFSDFEMIVVDDGSSDGTIDLVHATAGGDPRIIVMNAPHGGPAAARNVGLRAARGRFMALLDSDDVWDPTFLADQFEKFELHPGVAVVSANAINRGGPLDGRPLWTQTAGCREVTLREVLTDECSVLVLAVFRREVFERIGGFDRRFTGNEDYEFWIRAANAGFRILQNRRPLAHYRRRAGSLSADEIRMLNGMLAVMESVLQMPGPIEHEREAIARQMAHLREEIVTIQMRSSLSRQDGRAAALGLKALSEMRNSWSLAVAARLGMVWPHLLVRAYGLRRSMRAS